MKELKTIHGVTFIVDDEDYEKAKEYRWRLLRDKRNKRCQVVMYSGRKGGLEGTSYKKLILGLGSKWTLFKNDNPLDLRKENIMVFDTRKECLCVINKKYEKSKEGYAIVSKALQGRVKKTNKKHKYIGINYDQSRQHSWRCSIVHRNKRYSIGSFIKEEYAALAYDQKALELYGPNARRNFPYLTEEELMEKLVQIKEEEAILFHDFLSKSQQGMVREYKSFTKSSQYIGVFFDKNNNVWKASTSYCNKNYYLGTFSTEEDAARAYDKKVLELYGEDANLNLPDSTIEKLAEVKLENINTKDAEHCYEKCSIIRQGNYYREIPKTSKYIGVSVRNRPNKKWKARISHYKKEYRLGDFLSEEDAARAYDKKALELYGESAKLNFPRK